MSRAFLDEDFLLLSEPARQLFHTHAKHQPIFDYHNHLSPRDMAEDRRYENLTQAWLLGDHYKWRAMRTNGVGEKYVTGSSSDAEKFQKWGETIPYTIRNPLYHWTHLELQRYFGILDILGPATSRDIYDKAGALLARPDYSVRGLLKKQNVVVVCTTDDPADDLAYHLQMKKSPWGVKVLPTFRPDKLLLAENTADYNAYLDRLSAASGVSIHSFDTLLEAVKNRHDYFHEAGCRLSDHGLEEPYAEDYTTAGVAAIFKKVRGHNTLAYEEVRQLKTALMVEFFRLNHARGWTQQLHLGPIRNNSTRLFKALGPDIGCDSMGDARMARPLSKFLDMLDRDDRLGKTILYNINPAQNEMMATMIGNFQDGSMPGKIQYGSGWWFLDQKDGMERQINALSNMGLLARFVGMLTDSRSFLSFPRHEYFRRILCNLIGRDVVNGELPNDMAHLGQVVEDICYNNAAKYFNLP